MYDTLIMVERFRLEGIWINGFGYMKDDCGNFKNEGYEQGMKTIAKMIRSSIDRVVEECPWLGEMNSRRFISETRGYNYKQADWSGRASYTRNHMKCVLQINLAHVMEMIMAEHSPVQIQQAIYEIVVHEMAHFYYRFRDTEKWADAVIKIGKPIDFYSDGHKDKWSKTLWANEIHSIMTEFIVAKRDMYYCIDKSAFEEYKKLYEQLH